MVPLKHRHIWYQCRRACCMVSEVTYYSTVHANENGEIKLTKQKEIKRRTKQFQASSTLVRINLSTLLFLLPNNLAFVVAAANWSPEWRNLTSGKAGCIVEGHRRRFSKTQVSNAHMISATVPFLPFRGEFFSLLSRLIDCLQLNVAFYNDGYNDSIQTSMQVSLKDPDVKS